MGVCACNESNSRDKILVDFWEKNLIKNISHLEYSISIGINSLKPTNLDIIKKNLLQIFCKEYINDDYRDESGEIWNLAFLKYKDQFLELLSSVLFLCKVDITKTMIYFKELILFKIYFDKSKSNKWYNRNLLCGGTNTSITYNENDEEAEKGISDCILYVGHFIDTLEVYFDLVLNLPREFINELELTKVYSPELIKSFIKKMLVTEQLNYSTDDTESERKFKVVEITLGEFFNKNYEILSNISKLKDSLDEFSVYFEEVNAHKIHKNINNILERERVSAENINNVIGINRMSIGNIERISSDTKNSKNSEKSNNSNKELNSNRDSNRNSNKSSKN